MVEFIFLFALLSPVLIGYLLIHLLVPGMRSGNRLLGIFWTLFLASGLGLALISIVHYIGSVLSNPASVIKVLFFIELAAIIILSVIFFRRKLSRIDQESYPFPSPNQKQRNWLALVVTLLFIILFVNYLDDWLRTTLTTPFGEWDAWAIWNLRASFIASGESWLSGFSEVISWSHPDYPLLLPLNVARLWILNGDRTVWVPIILSLIFQISLLGFLITSIQLLRGYVQGMLAGLISILVLFAALSFKLYADIPLAFYFLAANFLIFLSDSESRPNQSFSLTAGLLLGAALWTKNEGWAMLAATVISKLILDFYRYRSFSQSKAWWGYFLLGVSPFILAVLHLKIVYAPPGDLLENSSISGMVNSILSPGRYLTILRFLKDQILEYGNLIIPMIPLMLVYALIAGFSIPSDQKKASISLALRIFILADLYFLVYLFTPKDLVWHLGTSLERLVTHILPSFILLFFLVVSSPNQEEQVNS